MDGEAGVKAGFMLFLALWKDNAPLYTNIVMVSAACDHDLEP